MKIVAVTPIPEDDPVFDWMGDRKKNYQLVHIESDHIFKITENKMRQIRYQDVGLFTDKIKIIANEPGAGGASTEYHIECETGPVKNEYAIALDPSVSIKFQVGNPLEQVNGITNEALLSILIDRMEGFQSGPFKTREAAIVLTKLEEALLWMMKRTLDRRDRGVEGKMEK